MRCRGAGYWIRKGPRVRLGIVVWSPVAVLSRDRRGVSLCVETAGDLWLSSAGRLECVARGVKVPTFAKSEAAYFRIWGAREGCVDDGLVARYRSKYLRTSFRDVMVPALVENAHRHTSICTGPCHAPFRAILRAH